MTTTKSVSVAASNTEQLRAWDGDEGAYWAVTPTTSTAPSPSTTGGCSPPRRSPPPTASSTSAAAPVRRHATPPEPHRRDRLSASTCRRQMLDHARRRAAAEGVDERVVPAGRRPDPPFRTRVVRPRHQPNRGDVLRRPGRRVRQHRPCARAGRPAGAHRPGRSGRPTSGSARSRARSPPVVICPAPPPTRLARSRSPIPTESAPSSPAPGSPTSTSRRSRRPMWFGTDAEDAHRFVLGLMGWMLDGLDETAVPGLSTTCDRRSTPTPPQTASSSGRPRGRSPPHGHDRSTRDAARPSARSTPAPDRAS